MRLWLRGLGLTVVCVAAVVASFSTLASLAAFTGWGERSSWLLPASLDALGMTACLVWLDANAPVRARRHACWLTWTASGLSILGNGAGHLASTGHLSQGLLLVVLVGAVPPAALTTTVHLIFISSSPEVKAVPVPDAAPVPAAKPVPSQRIVPGPAKPSPAKKAAPKKTAPKPSQDEVDEVLVHRARKLDEDWRAKHGKPISRDDARPLLGVSNEKTGEALRLAREGVAS